MKLHHYLHIACALLLSSCAATPPLGQLLPPGNHPHVAIARSLKLKNNGISYTDAGLQAAQMYGILGMAVGGTMKMVSLSNTAEFSKKWQTSGRDAWGIVQDEFKKTFNNAGYTLDDAAADKVELKFGNFMITSDKPNAAASNKNYMALINPQVVAHVAGSKRVFMTGGRSETTFSFTTLTPDVYEAALREAARSCARAVLYGVDLKTGKPRG